VSTASNDHSDLSKESLGKQVSSFGYIFWVANWIELVERYAWCGVRVVSPLFIVGVFDKGGLQLTHTQRGEIFAVWAFIQTFVPVLSGGLADRFGCKLCVALATVINIAAYVIMGYTVVLAEWLCGMSLAEARLENADYAYQIFFVGVMFLGFGTGIFKPGLQGLLAKEMPKNAASLGWSIFYQIVNVGAFLGPFVAGKLRTEYGFRYVFLASAAAISLNFLPLLIFREPPRTKAVGKSVIDVLFKTTKGLLDPRLFFFTISFAGFWLMFMQLFDSLPVYITDWVDTRGLAQMLQKVFGIFGESASKIVPVEDGKLAQEWLVNVNALQICFLAFLVGYFTGKLRSLTAIIVGIGIAAVSIFALGVSASGWVILGAIVAFSLGEMMASPTTNRYLASISPPGKEGQYMGYLNFTVGIGWSIGNIISGRFYEEHGDKAGLACRYMIDQLHMAKEQVEAIDKAEVMKVFEKTVGMDAWGARQLLWDTYHPYVLWYILAAIGALSMLALLFYTRIVNAANKNPDHPLNRQGYLWVLAFLVLICLTLVAAIVKEPDSIGLWLNLSFFTLLLLVGATTSGKETDGSSAE